MSRFALVAALICLTAAPATAQRPQTRDGFWISGGLGYGSLDIGCEGCESDREGGVTALLAMGGTTGRSLLLGAQLEGWYKEIDEVVDLTVGHLSAVAYWYPRSEAGFFLKGGIGMGRLIADAGAEEERDSGIALHGGLGYDVRLGRTLSLTPAAGIFWLNLEPNNAHVLHIGVSVTGH